MRLSVLSFFELLRAQSHPLALLNHNFHDTANISYRTVIEETLQKRLQIIESLNIGKDSAEIDRHYEYFRQDCAVLIEKLNSDFSGVSEELKKDLWPRIKGFKDMLEQTAPFDRKSVMLTQYPFFQETLRHMALGVAGNVYSAQQEEGKSVPVTELSSMFKEDIRTLLADSSVKGLAKLSEALNGESRFDRARKERDHSPNQAQTGAAANYSGEKWEQAYQELIDNPQNIAEYIKSAECTLSSIKQWQEQYLQLPQQEAFAFSTTLQKDLLTVVPEYIRSPLGGLNTSSSESSVDQKFEYLLAEYCEDLNKLVTELKKLPKKYENIFDDDEEEEIDLDFITEEKYYHLSEHLYSHLNAKILDSATEPGVLTPQTHTLVFVSPIKNCNSDHGNINVPEGLTLQSAGTVKLYNFSKDNLDGEPEQTAVLKNSCENSSRMPVSQIQYSEFVDNDNKISLINNHISGPIKDNELNDILNHQVNYIQGAESRDKPIADDFVFRIEFKSEQDFHTHKKTGKLQKMLKKFSENHTDLKIKVVIKSDASAQQIEKHFASFSELFGEAPTTQKSLYNRTPTSQRGNSSGKQTSFKCSPRY